MDFDAIQWGKLVGVRRIKTGGMAELFFAERITALGISKPLVIKSVHPKLKDDPVTRSLFIQEAKIHSVLNHPHIVQFYDLGTESNELYLALEYVSGGNLNDLQQVISERSTFERASIALQLLEEIGSAFSYFHESAIHRDISPENILFDRAGCFKLCDFGLARPNGAEAVWSLRQGQGKFRYMSPEQVSGSRIDHRSDIFSLGLCAVELCSGKKIYADVSQKDLLRFLRQGTYLRYLSALEIPAGLREIIDLCTQPSPKDRFQSALELVSACRSARNRLWMQGSSCSLQESLRSEISVGPSSENVNSNEPANKRQDLQPSPARAWAKALTILLVSPILLLVPLIGLLRKGDSGPTSPPVFTDVK